MVGFYIVHLRRNLETSFVIKDGAAQNWHSLLGLGLFESTKQVLSIVFSLSVAWYSRNYVVSYSSSFPKKVESTSNDLHPIDAMHSKDDEEEFSFGDECFPIASPSAFSEVELAA